MRLAAKVLAASSLLLAGVLGFAAPAKAGSRPELKTPLISCVVSTQSSIELNVCGTGTYGAPYGFSIHMMTRAEYDIDGWDESKSSYRCWSLQGTCGPPGFDSPWGLGPGECVTLTIDPDFVIRYMDVPGVMCGASEGCGRAILQCGTEYVFRVFAHGGREYDISPKGVGDKLGNTIADYIACRTAPCQPDGGCTYTWGYWKTHGPEIGCNPGNQINDWDVASLNIGSLNLDQAALCAIFQENPGACAKGVGANAVIILEHQLIAAMLNVANGAISCPSANQAIVDANNILSGYEYACVGTSTVLGQQMLAIKDALAAYNSDICQCPVPAGQPSSLTTAPTTAKKSTWGQLKSIYR